MELIIYTLGFIATLALLYNENGKDDDPVNLSEALVWSVFSWGFLALVVILKLYDIYISPKIQTNNILKEINNRYNQLNKIFKRNKTEEV